MSTFSRLIFTLSKKILLDSLSKTYYLTKKRKTEADMEREMAGGSMIVGADGVEYYMTEDNELVRCRLPDGTVGYGWDIGTARIAAVSIQKGLW